jgi:ribosomal protein S18 acetylase RimI-like enzyme
MQLEAFSEEHLEAAGRLLAARHRAHRAAEPLLSPLYEDPGAARVQVEAAWRTDRASGAVAMRDGRVVGYLIGAPAGDAWGPNVWVHAAGHAVEEPETLRDLYGLWAGPWVEAGRTAHYALVPSHDRDLVAAWFRVGFGAQHAHGIQAVPGVAAAPALDGIEVRRAGPDDVDACLVLDRVLPDYQEESPVFGRITPPPSPEEVRADWREELADENAACFVAFRDGRALGGANVAPVEYSGAHAGLARPDGACILGWAATLEEERGRGIGVAVTDEVFAWARERGYETIVVDCG